MQLSHWGDNIEAGPEITIYPSEYQVWDSWLKIINSILGPNVFFCTWTPCISNYILRKLLCIIVLFHFKTSIWLLKIHHYPLGMQLVISQLKRIIQYQSILHNFYLSLSRNMAFLMKNKIWLLPVNKFGMRQQMKTKNIYIVRHPEFCLWNKEHEY